MEVLGGYWPFHRGYADLSTLDLIGIVTTTAAALGIWLWWYRWSQRHSLGPKTWPFIGSLLEVRANWENLHEHITSYLYKAGTQRVSLGFGYELLFTVDPAAMEYIMKTNFNNYPKGPLVGAINYDFFGHGIFNVDGEFWRQQRKLAAIEFASSRLRDFSTTVFREYAVRLASVLLEKARSPKSQINLQDVMARMTMDTTVKVGFGVELGCLSPSLPDLPIAKCFEIASVCSFLRFVDPFWKVKRFLQVGREKKMKQAVETLDKFAYDIIQRVRAEGKGMEHVHEEKDDLLSRFLKLSTEGDSRFDNRALRDIMINFVLAGRDSTAGALSWLFYMLYRHPEVTAKIREELSSLEKRCSKPGKEGNQTPEESFRSFAELLTFENLTTLSYLHAALTETMRLYPPLPLNAKQPIKDDVLPDGTKVNKGSMVVLHPYGMGRMPYIWGPDAAEFKPERWIKDGVFQPESPFKYIAFQAGPRVCLGKESSYLQIKLTTALIVRFFDWHLVPGHIVTYRTMISLVMRYGLKVTVSLADSSLA